MTPAAWLKGGADEIDARKIEVMKNGILAVAATAIIGLVWLIGTVALQALEGVFGWKVLLGAVVFVAFAWALKNEFDNNDL